MSENIDAWFHCGRCGTVFRSPIGDVKDRRCPSCGSNPSLGYSPQPAAPLSTTPTTVDNLPHKAPPRRQQPLSATVKLVGGWSLLVIVIVIITKLISKDLPKNEQFVPKQKENSQKVSSEDLALLEVAVPICKTQFSGFLSAQSPEERNQFVSSPVATAARMARFYQLNPIKNLDPQTLSPVQNAVLHLPSGPAIEMHWKSTTGGIFDILFVQENGEWKLDWDHYVRNSDYPWPLFIVGGGDDQGEFRLLARERLASERSGKDTISIVLCAPRHGSAKELGSQSPAILVPRDSKNGRLLSAAFKLLRDKKGVFGLPLDSLNPEDFIRVRASVRRSKAELGYTFEIEDIRAIHWYSEASPGVDVPADPEKK
jgi:hypothetical protein